MGSVWITGDRSGQTPIQSRAAQIPMEPTGLAWIRCLVIVEQRVQLHASLADLQAFRITARSNFRRMAGPGLPATGLTSGLELAPPQALERRRSNWTRFHTVTSFPRVSVRVESFPPESWIRRPAVVEKIGTADDDEDVRCQIILRHRDAERLPTRSTTF